MNNPDLASILTRRLNLISELNKQDHAAIRDLRFETRSLDHDVDIVEEGKVLDRCYLVIVGTTVRYRLMAKGKRQIVAFHITGDILDFQSLHIKKMSYALTTLTPSEVAFIAHRDVWDVCLARPPD